MGSFGPREVILWRCAKAVITALFVYLPIHPYQANAQSLELMELRTAPVFAAAAREPTRSPFIGTWSYRSFHNNPDLSVPFNQLRFGTGALELAQPSFDTLTGSLGGTGWNLNPKGWVTYGTPTTIRFQGKGRIGGEEWVYDYMDFLSPNWPNGDGQRPAIVGTIVRTAAHSNGQAKAGYVASWIAVRQD